jgi:hypothetical protein
MISFLNDLNGNNLEIIQTKLQSLKSIIPKDEWKYFHIESVENFIFHLDNIESDRTRKRIENEINFFLVLVEKELAGQKSLTAIYKDLYSKKLHSIATFYQDELRFIKKPYYPLTILGFIILFAVLFKFVNIFFAIIITILSIVFYLLRTSSKIRAKKYYY